MLAQLIKFVLHGGGGLLASFLGAGAVDLIPNAWRGGDYAAFAWGSIALAAFAVSALSCGIGGVVLNFGLLRSVAVTFGINFALWAWLRKVPTHVRAIGLYAAAIITALMADYVPVLFTLPWEKW